MLAPAFSQHQPVSAPPVPGDVRFSARTARSITGDHLLTHPAAREVINILRLQNGSIPALLSTVVDQSVTAIVSIAVLLISHPMYSAKQVAKAIILIAVLTIFA